jgi:hypothetical protein
MRYLAIIFLVLCVPFCWLGVAVAQQNCAVAHAVTLVALQGKMSSDVDSKGHWQTARLNDVMCEGSRVRVEANSTASLRFPDGIVLRLGEGSVLWLNSIKPKPTIPTLLRAIFRFIDPRKNPPGFIAPIAGRAIQDKKCAV